VDFHPSALKHGIPPDDTEHAIRHAMVIEGQDDGLTLFLGPSPAGTMLEVVTLRRDDDADLVIHAMAMRSKYRRLIEGW
jgi:hypothetical protein